MITENEHRILVSIYFSVLDLSFDGVMAAFNDSDNTAGKLFKKGWLFHGMKTGKSFVVVTQTGIEQL